MRLARLLHLSARASVGALWAVLVATSASPVPAEVPAVEALREASAQARAGDWGAAAATAATAGALVEGLVEWRALRQEEGPDFLRVARFVADHPHWPDIDDVRANGERSILPGTAPAAVAAFFGAAPPQTGEGAVALAAALGSLGRGAEAEAMLVDAWLTLPIDEDGQAAMLRSHGALLAPHHAARADAMLWRWRTSDAERMLPLLADDRRALVRARVAVIRGNAPDLDALPAALRDDAGLAFDRFNHLAEDGDYTDAEAILRARSVSAVALGDPARWAPWRAQVARWAMREGRHADAYALAASHFAMAGDAFADNEWLAGYLSLRFLGEPERALQHFRASEAAVTGPISLSRAAYWTGRALESLGDPDAAAEAFARAARHQTAFYGLLAAERLGLTLDPTLAGLEEFGDWRASPHLAGDLGQAMLLLLAAGERGEATRFALQLARTLPREGVGQLGSLLEEMGEPHIAVLAGKAAVERGVVVPTAYFPLHPLARGGWPVDADLALSIARRESEFNAGVSSPVGARGLMQVMPATAREVAGWLNIPYSEARLTEWEYNAALGTRYLQMLEDTFGTSPVLIAAGYNAGPGRPRTWMAQRGDPRDASVDMVDWIEHIPFAETRTYVMRVAEGIPVYRARLTGEAGTVAFTALLRGERPVVRPEARPERAEAERAAVVGRLSTSDFAAALRPRARP